MTKIVENTIENFTESSEKNQLITSNLASSKV